MGREVTVQAPLPALRATLSKGEGKLQVSKSLHPHATQITLLTTQSAAQPLHAFQSYALKTHAENHRLRTAALRGSTFKLAIRIAMRNPREGGKGDASLYIRLIARLIIFTPP
jgi:hypothetical protein